MRETFRLDKKPQKIDRRVLRTRQALRNSLLELIKEKEFDLISVEEITERANLGRATFYLHYKDKEDLMLEEFRKIAEDRVQVLSEIPFSAWNLSQDNLNLLEGISTSAPLLVLFEHAEQNVDLYRILLRGKNSQRVAQQMQIIISQSINDIIETKMGSESIVKKIEIPIELLSAYFSGAMISTINWWIDQEIPCRAEEMARMFQYLVLPGMIKVWSAGTEI